MVNISHLQNLNKIHTEDIGVMYIYYRQKCKFFLNMHITIWKNLYFGKIINNYIIHHNSLELCNW
jgi:hypothetical protein